MRTKVYEVGEGGIMSASRLGVGIRSAITIASCNRVRIRFASCLGAGIRSVIMIARQNRVGEIDCVSRRRGRRRVGITSMRPVEDLLSRTRYGRRRSWLSRMRSVVEIDGGIQG